MGCLVGKIERIGEGLKGCIERSGNTISCGITLACEIRHALVRRIGDGLDGSVSRIGGMKANVSLVCAVNDTYSCFGHGYWSNDDDWLNGDGWRNEDIVEY